MSRREHKLRDSFFSRRARTRRLQYVTILPSLVTLCNGVFGFAAIGLAAKGPQHFAAAGYMIFAAMIADMLDGRLARMSHSTSSFGGQLDSLCDVISFGAAPAFLGLNLLMNSLPAVLSPSTELLGDFATRLIWLASAVYLCCASVRLARFNVENIEDETAHLSFSGLPTPAAAGVIASMVILHQHTITDPARVTILFRAGRFCTLYLLAPALIALAVLMVSRIKYPHIINQYLRGKKPIAHLLWILGLAGMIYLCGIQMAAMIVFGGFAFSGLIRWLWRYAAAGRSPEQKPLPQPDASEHPAQ